MKNQKALTSTAMLAAIWEKEQKDTLELLVPFVTYAISETTSVDGLIDIEKVSKVMDKEFAFNEIPNVILQKVFTRLIKREILYTKDEQVFLWKSLDEHHSKMELQREKVQNQTEKVLNALTEYLNTKKSIVLGKNLTNVETEGHLTSFLDKSGYHIYTGIEGLTNGDPRRSNFDYHISQFIFDQHDGKTEIFSYLKNFVMGLFLARVIYGYSGVQFNEKFKDLCIYLATAFLLSVFGFKTEEENVLARQLVDILKVNSVPVKCFMQNYEEVEGVIKTYKKTYKKVFRQALKL